MKINSFNTGRLYSMEGQLIVWTQDEEGLVHMVDHTRGLDYIYDITNPTDDRVLGAYDRNEDLGLMFKEEHRTIKEQLKQFAKGVK